MENFKNPEILNLKTLLWLTPPHPQLLKTMKCFHQQMPLDQNWIVVGSTSIYPESGEFDETLHFKAYAQQSSMYPIEEWFSQEFFKSSSRSLHLIRAGGLVDPKRHPGRFFKNKTEVSGAQTPVNLIRTEDVANFIEQGLSHPTSGITNLVHPHHPLKQDYYSTMYQQYWGERCPINWLEEKSFHRIIHSKLSHPKLKQENNFQFRSLTFED